LQKSPDSLIVFLFCGGIKEKGCLESRRLKWQMILMFDNQLFLSGIFSVGNNDVVNAVPEGRGGDVESLTLLPCLIN
jgi:hypothetical protein